MTTEYESQNESQHDPQNESENEPQLDAAAIGEAESTTGPSVSRRPFGFWLKLVDRRISDEMASLFEDEGLSRRDWRALNLLAGAADDENLAARLWNKPHLLHRLAAHGWVDETRDGETSLNSAGAEARERLQSRVAGLRSRVAGAVSDEDFATTVRTLEAIARELGWDETQPMPRGHRGGRRFGGERGDWHGHGERGHWRGERGERKRGHGHGHGTGHHGQENCGHHGRGHGHEHGHQRGDVQVHIHVHN